MGRPMARKAEGYQVFGGCLPGLGAGRIASVMHVQFFVRGATLLTRPLITHEDGEALLLPARITQGAAVGRLARAQSALLAVQPYR
jgi:hypothetical protein